MVSSETVRVRGPALLPIAVCWIPARVVAATASFSGVPFLTNIWLFPRIVTWMTLASCSFMEGLIRLFLFLCALVASPVLLGLVFVFHGFIVPPYF